MDNISSINLYNTLQIRSSRIPWKAAYAFFFMVTISTMMCSMLEGVRVREFVFSLTLEIAMSINSIHMGLIPLVAIGLIELGFFMSVELLMRRSQLVCLSSRASNLNIFSKDLIYGTGFISFYILSVVFALMIPQHGILISISSITLIVIYYLELMRRGLSIYCSEKTSEHVDTYYIQGGL
jgi:hypothetical protein